MNSTRGDAFGFGLMISQRNRNFFDVILGLLLKSYNEILNWKPAYNSNIHCRKIHKINYKLMLYTKEILK